MRRKTKFYLALGVFGVVLALLSLVLEDTLPKNLGGMLMGAGAGAFGFGFSNWRMCRREERDPALLKKGEIEAHDERNVAIRHRAQAVSGEVLQWAVMGAGFLSIALGAPLWVTLAAIGVFVAKSLLELCLMVRYQREM